jgi:hypothetical protein
MGIMGAIYINPNHLILPPVVGIAKYCWYPLPITVGWQAVAGTWTYFHDMTNR